MRSLTNNKELFKHLFFLSLTLMFIIFILMIVASMLIYTAENEAQPEIFGNALSGLWLSFIGYNGISPVTAFGKAMAVFLAVLRACFLSVPIGVILAGFIVKTHKNNDKN